MNGSAGVSRRGGQDGLACHYRDAGKTKGFALPYDTARCAGVQYDGEWREGCDDCMRRTAIDEDFKKGAGARIVYMTPPALVVFWCEFHIEPRKT